MDLNCTCNASGGRALPGPVAPLRGERQLTHGRYHTEPTGTFYRYDAKAIGSGSEGAQAELQNEYHSSLTIEEAELLVLKVLKQVMEEKLDSKNAQLSSVTKEHGFKIYNDEEMAVVVEKLEAQTGPDEAAAAAAAASSSDVLAS